jgi:hypothetical protein
MSQELSHSPCIYGSTDAVLQDLARLNLPDDVVFSKVDIKGFFIRGRPNQLNQNAFLHIEADICFAASKRTLTLVLENQVVYSDVLDSYLSVSEGTGIGLQLSGDLADITFWRRVERSWLMRDSIRAHYGIYFYGRYRDDIFIISAPQLHSCLLAEM